MWYLMPNVYFVKGAKNGILYDLNSGCLYKVSSRSKELIEKMLDHNPNQRYTEEENAYFQKMREKNLIDQSHHDEPGIRSIAKKSKINFAWIEVTDMCNLRCIHCYEEAKCGHGKILSYSDFCHIVDELVQNKIENVQLIGGEPFSIGNRIFNFLDYAIGKFKMIEIFTNGTLVKEQWLPYFKKNNIRFALSVYSNISEYHDRVTKVPKSWERTNQTIKKLHDFGITYRVCNVLMKNIPLGRNNNNLYSLNPNKDVVRLTGRGNLRLLNSELIAKRLITPRRFTMRINKYFISHMVSGHNCFANRLYISVNSEVFPCVMERRVSHGNLRGKSLQSVLKESLMSLNKDCIDVCKDCEYRYACFDCRPDANGKSFYAKPWYCTYNPYKGEWADSKLFIQEILKE